jgi:hypothetical protein
MEELYIKSGDQIMLVPTGRGSRRAHQPVMVKDKNIYILMVVGGIKINQMNQS